MIIPKSLKAFSLIELSIVVLIIGVVTLVALNGRSLVIKANCAAENFGSKNIANNMDNPSALTVDANTTYNKCVTRKLNGNICNTWQTNINPTAFHSSIIGGSASNVFNTNNSLVGDLGSGWLSQDGLGTLQRIYLDLGDNYVIGGIRVVNFHHNASYTNQGIKNAKVYLTKTPPTTVHNTNVSNVDMIFDGIFPQNSGSNSGANYSVLTLSKELTGRYLVIDSYASWYDPPPYNRVGLRRVEYCIW